MLFLFVLLWILLWALLNDRKRVFWSAFWNQAVSLLSWGYSREIRLNGGSLLILRRSQTSCSLMFVGSVCDTDQTVVISPNIQAPPTPPVPGILFPGIEWMNEWIGTDDALGYRGWGVVPLCDCCSPSNLCWGSLILHIFVFGSTSLSSILNTRRLKSC